MTNLVISNQALAAPIGEGRAFHTRNYTINSIIYLSKAGGSFATPSGKNRCFI